MQRTRGQCREQGTSSKQLRPNDTGPGDNEKRENGVLRSILIPMHDNEPLKEHITKYKIQFAVSKEQTR